MTKIIRATELARIMGLKSYFFRDNWYRKTKVGVRMRPRAAYFSVDMARALACRFHRRSSPIPLEEILRQIDEYDA